MFIMHLADFQQVECGFLLLFIMRRILHCSKWTNREFFGMFLQHSLSELHTNCKVDIQDCELYFQIQAFSS